MKERDVRLLIPENLDIDKIIDENKELCFPKMNRNKLLVIADRILKARIVQRKEMEEYDALFANVSSKKLQALVYDYRKYLDFLLRAGVIATDNHYITGEKSKAYRFNYPFAGKKLKSTLLMDSNLRKAIKRERKKAEHKQKKDLWGYGYLTKWWETEKLEIDVEGAVKFIEEDLSQKLNAINDDFEIKDKQAKIDQATDTAEDFRYLVHTLKGKTYIGFSGEGKRFYNPITNIKKGLRQYLTYDGKPLVEIDIKNSQPFLSTALFDEDFWKPYDKSFGEKLNLEKIDKEMFDKVCRMDIINDIIMLLKSFKTQVSKGFCVENYIHTASSSTFYERMQAFLGRAYPDKFKDRDSTKREMLKILYMKPAEAFFYDPAKAFKALFPEVYHLFNIIKSIEHNLLSLILQRIESFLVIDVVCKRISKEYPDVTLFTIHDCILTTTGNEDIVNTILKEEIKKYIGYEPETSIKSYNLIKAA